MGIIFNPWRQLKLKDKNNPAIRCLSRADAQHPSIMLQADSAGFLSYNTAA